MTHSNRLGFLAILVCIAILPTAAQESKGIETMDVPYTVDGKDFVGFLAYNPAIRGPQPGILVVHEWRGINEYAKKRAMDLAAEGYVAFALDMYGDGREVPMDQARSMSGSIGSDFPLIENRFNAALEILKDSKMVDSENLAAIGYCFGGGIVLNMARMGTDLNGIVSFHGSINTGLSAEKGDIRTRILAFQGDGDPAAPKEKRDLFSAEMENSGADFNYIIYDGVAAHNFTNPQGNSYYEDEAMMAWDTMLEFFAEIFTD